MPQRAASKRAEGSRSAAALLATWRISSRVRLGRGAEALDLLLGEGGVGVGRREVRHQAHDLRAERRQLREAPAAHAGVQLQVHRARRREILVPPRELEPRLARLGDLAAGRGRAHHEDPRVAELGSQLEPLGDGRDAERAGALVEHRAGDIDRAVPVGVGLHDRPELRAVEHAQQRPRVAPDRAEVDGQLRPVHRAPAGSAATTSLADRSRLRDRARRELLRRRGRGRRRARVDALGEERRDDPGQHVAAAGRGQRGRPERDDEHALARRGDERVRALEQADAVEVVRGALHRLEPVRGDPVRLDAEQARELALVRREHGRRGPLERLEVVQAVGVDHRGTVELGQQPPHDFLRPGAAAEARARARATPPSRRTRRSARSRGSRSGRRPRGTAA